MKEASEYGKNYWCVKIPQELSEESENIEATLSDTSELYLYADTCVILPSGALEFRRACKDEVTGEKSDIINLAFAPGEWVCVYAAELEDGSAVAVES